VPLFLKEAAAVLAQAKRLKPFRATVVTGESPYHYLADFLRDLARKTGTDLQPIAVKNVLFGETVTVTGLVSGRDIIAALRGRELGEMVIIPDVMLKEGEGVFLDDLSVAELEEVLGIRVIVVEATPQGIYDALS
jgi:NifB/MoaA-like Fe-S oxidoreductase